MPAVNGASFKHNYYNGWILMNKGKLVDIMANDSWKWPLAWYDLFLVLNQVVPPILSNDHEDKLILEDF